MACDATARLYDVDEDSVVFTKLKRTEKYDQGTVKFRARKGRLIDLEKLHESIWATRLSGGTRSGLVSLEVVVIGEPVKTQDAVMLRVQGSNKKFILAQDPDKKQQFDQVTAAIRDGQTVQLTGRIDNYVGRWPTLFKRKLPGTRTILVTAVKVLE